MKTLLLALFLCLCGAVVVESVTVPSLWTQEEILIKSGPEGKLRSVVIQRDATWDVVIEDKGKRLDYSIEWLWNNGKGRQR